MGTVPVCAAGTPVGGPAQDGRYVNPDVAAVGMNPLEHFVGHGWKDRRNAHPMVDTAYYLESNPDVAARGVAYGLPSVRLDGNDVLAVHEAAGEAVRRARRGDGPTLLECLTYRTRAHSEGMRDAGYRTRDEVEAWKARCPIARWRDRLLAAGGVAASDLDCIDQEVAALVKEAAEFAEASPWPDPATAMRHVYAEPGETR